MIEKPEITSTQRIYTGWLRLDVLTLREGGVTRKYDVVTSKGGVAILPFLDNDTVLLARQYRPPVDDYLLELIQGGLKTEDESAEEAARRELLEETGYEGKIEHLATFFPFPTALNMRLHIMKAYNLRKVQEPEDNPLERLTLVEMPYKQLLEEVLSGKHKDSALREAVMCYQLALIKS
ncbi:MAG: NUDIX hydrolase [DPANN group archaeon]|nr:NUDIX hydrolase [DPANN group archaeon]